MYECGVIGTLTKNEMKLVKFVVGGKLFDILAPGDSNGSTHSQLNQKNADDDIKVVVAYFGWIIIVVAYGILPPLLLHYYHKWSPSSCMLESS